MKKINIFSIGFIIVGFIVSVLGWIGFPDVLSGGYLTILIGYPLILIGIILFIVGLFMKEKINNK